MSGNILGLAALDTGCLHRLWASVDFVPAGYQGHTMTARFVAPQVEFNAVTKRYAKGKVVLDALDLNIAKGEFVTLLGPSGCGKSTVLKLISGLATPTAGAIKIDGMAPANARETVSYIFQDATLL